MNIASKSANRAVQSDRNLNRAAKRKQVLQQATLEQLENRTLLSYTFALTGSTATVSPVASTGGPILIDEVMVAGNPFLEWSADGGSTFSTDWDSTTAGTQTLAASTSSTVNLTPTTGAGSSITLGDTASPASNIDAQINLGVVGTPSNNSLIIDDSTSTQAAGTYNYDSTLGSVTGPGGAGGGINVTSFGPIGSYVIDGGPAGNTFNIHSTFNATTTSTTIDGGTGNDTANVLGDTSPGIGTPLSIDLGAGTNTVNVGNGNLSAAVSAPVIVTDTAGTTSLVLNNTSNTASANATLDNLSGNVSAPFEVTGLSGAIEYGAGVTALNINGGTNGGSGVTYNVNNTQSGTTTTITGGANQNFYDLSNASEAGGLDNLPGPVSIHGGSGGADVVTLEDSSADFNDSYTVTDTTVSRIVFGGLTYDDNIGTLTLNAENSLGDDAGNNTITINNTADFVTTNINGQGGNDTIDVNSTGSLGALNVSTGSSGSTVNVVADNEAVNLNLGDGDVVNIGSTGGAGTMAGILGAIGINDIPDFYTLTFHDENDTTGQTWTLDNDDTSGSTGSASIALTGSATTTYHPGDLNSPLTINGGSGGNTFAVNNTSANFTTILNTGTGDDTVNVLATGSGGLDINGQDGLDTVTLGGVSSVGMQNLAGTINVSNNSDFTALTLDDSEDTAGQTATLSDDGTTGTVSGLSPATISYPDIDISGLSINGGSGGNDFTVNGTLANPLFPDTLTTLSKGAGSNTVNVDAITANTTLDLTGTGSPDTINLGSNGDLSGIQGNLAINEAPGSTNLVIDLSSDTSPHAFDLSSDGTTSTLVDEDGNLPNPITFNTAAIATLTIDGNSAEDESLNVNFGSGGGDPIPSGSPGLVFNAGDPADGVSHALTFTGELGSGPFASETHTANDQSVFPAVGQYGSFAFDDGTGSPTALTSVNYTGLNPITDTTPVLNYTFNDAADDNSFTAQDGPVVLGFQTLEFVNTPESGPETFETTDIANKTNVTFNTTDTPGMSGVINVPIASDGLASLTFNTLTNGENDVAVLVTPAGIATAINGGTDQDTTNITGSGINAGDVLVLTGGPGVDTLNYDADGVTPTITAGLAAGEVLITIPGAGTVDAIGYENVNLTDVAPVVITPGATVPVSAVEGAAKNVTVGTFTLPLAAIGITNPAGLPASDFTATINWGDGSSSPGTITQDATNPSLYYISGTHTYPAQGTFTVTDSIAFAGATYSNNLNGAVVSVTVAPAGPTAGTSSTATVAAAPLDAQGTTITGTEGISTGSVLLATFTDNGTAGVPAGYTATINWGDGSSTTAATSITSTGTSDGVIYSVFGNHIYADEGNYAITVTITKTASGAEAIASSQAVIADAALTGTPVTFTVNTGTTSSLVVGTFTDADPTSPISDFTAIIFWGDGSNSAGTITQPGGVGTRFLVTGTHAYATAGAYTITTNVTDIGGSAVTLTSSATATDVAVTGAVRSFPAVEGQNTGTIVVGTFTDPNPLATAASLTATLGIGGWGDGTPAAAATLTVVQIGGNSTSSLFEITGSHTYADEGSFPVNISVTTSGGVTTALTAGTATVADAVLSPSLGTPIVATEGAASKTFVVGTFTDENPGATIADFTAVVTATSSTGATFTGSGVTFTALGGGAFSVSAGLTFPTAGVWSVSTLVTDDGGNKALLITTANVAAAPLIPGTSPNIISTVKLSTGLVVVGTFTDANPNPTAGEFSSVIDWGDGSPTSLGTISITPGVAGGPSTINILGMHTYEAFGQYTVTVVTTEDGGQTVTTTSTAIANQPHLVFVSGPATTVAGNRLPVITVNADDAFGNLAFQDHSRVKLEIFTGTPAEGKLIGFVTAQIKKGVAHFSTISLKIAGDYTLVAVDGRYAQALSSVFSITPAAPKKVAFTSLPANASANNPFAVQVQVWDKYGNLEKSDSSIVSLTLGKHPRQASLSGVTTATASGGIATFNDVVVSTAGHYKLVAADSELPHKVASNTFAVG